MNSNTSSKLEQFWTAHIDSWQDTDLTQRAYCQEHELQIHRFVYWKRKLSDANDQPLEVQGFVQVSPMITTSSSLSVQLPNHVRIEGISSDNVYLVKQLVGALQ